MPDTWDVPQYDLPAGALLDAVALDGAADARSRLLTRLRNHRGKSRRELENWRALFDRLHDEAVRRDLSAEVLEAWAATLQEKERAALERLRPLMEKLQQKIADEGDNIDAEAQELFRQSIDSAFAWIAPYQTLRAKLLGLAADRRHTASRVLRTRPVEDDIDHTELSREFMARFPKIRAALAR